MTTPDIIAVICGTGIAGLLVGFIGGYFAFGKDTATASTAVRVRVMEVIGPRHLVLQDKTVVLLDTPTVAAITQGPTLNTFHRFTVERAK